jgi:hypothetical protein
MAGSATFGLMAGVIIVGVGDIRKLATKTIQIGVLVNFILPGNLRNAINDGRRLEQARSESVQWHVLGIRGSWGVM